jgi:hypothetical protein
MCLSCGTSQGGMADGARQSGANGSSANAASAGGGGSSAASSAAEGGSGALAATGSGGSGGASDMCPGSTNHTPGSRLRGRFAVTSEGDRAWQGWFDAELELNCVFNRAGDGQIRCLPVNYDISEEFFLDAQCTDAVYAESREAPCVPIDYLVVFRPSDCVTGAGYFVFERGEEVAAPASLYAKDQDGACAATGIPSDSGLFRRGPEVPPTSFMPGTSAELSVAGRLSARGYTASDGLRQVTSWADATLDGASCRFVPASDGFVRCQPIGARTEALFSDLACSAPLLSYAPGVCATGEAPAYATDYPEPRCPAGHYEILARGAEFSGQPYSLGTACAPTTAPVDVTLYETNTVPPDTFEIVRERIDMADSGRLKPRYYTSDAGGCWFRDFWDSELEIACAFRLAADGEYRCLPDGDYAVVTAFSNDACTESVGLLELDACIPSPLPPYVGLFAAAECGTVVAGYRTETLASASLPLWQLTDSTCVAMTPGDADYAVLTPVPDTLFIAGEPSVE